MGGRTKKTQINPKLENLLKGWRSRNKKGSEVNFPNRNSTPPRCVYSISYDHSWPNEHWWYPERVDEFLSLQAALCHILAAFVVFRKYRRIQNISTIFQIFLVASRMPDFVYVSLSSASGPYPFRAWVLTSGLELVASWSWGEEQQGRWKQYNWISTHVRFSTSRVKCDGRFKQFDCLVRIH